MPYIKQRDREILDAGMRNVQTCGELNYMITRLLQKYIAQNGGLSYMNVNAIVGALECAKLELYRRLAAPYENKKIQENGDVY